MFFTPPRRSHRPTAVAILERGYDLNSVRKLKSETEKALRLAQKENSALRRALKAVE
jgi:hypothetical protein